MKTTALLAAIALLATLLPASAQQPATRPTTERDINTLTKPILPVPDTNRIVIPFGDTARVYFKRPFKSIRVGDSDVVRARPESDHVIEFSGTSPGTSRFDLEANDGAAAAFGEVIVVREVHEVKIYMPVAAEKQSSVQNAGVVIVNQSSDSGNTNEAKKAAEAEYSSRLCNEAGCRPVPPAQ